MRLLNRHKILINTIAELNRNNIFSRIAIVKSQFLLKMEYGIEEQFKFYNFYPYKQGPFSQLCFYDLRNMKNFEILNEEETRLTNKGKDILNDLNCGFQAKQRINGLISRFPNGIEMTKYVYEKYPEFTVRSELIQQESKQLEKGITTIGYEGKDIDNFLNVLIENKVDVVIDVRKNPFSMNFCFTKSNLVKFLDSVKIKYLHIPELGIESEERKNLKTKADYDTLFKKYMEGLLTNEAYVNRIIEISEKQRVALLCYEKDVNFCHRGQIANFIRKKGIKVEEI